MEIIILLRYEISTYTYVINNNQVAYLLFINLTLNKLSG